jgi:hypothetical protein
MRKAIVRRMKEAFLITFRKRWKEATLSAEEDFSPLNPYS